MADKANQQRTCLASAPLQTWKNTSHSAAPKIREPRDEPKRAIATSGLDAAFPMRLIVSIRCVGSSGTSGDTFCFEMLPPPASCFLLPGPSSAGKAPRSTRSRRVMASRTCLARDAAWTTFSKLFRSPRSELHRYLALWLRFRSLRGHRLSTNEPARCCILQASNVGGPRPRSFSVDSCIVQNGSRFPLLS